MYSKDPDISVAELFNSWVTYVFVLAITIIVIGAVYPILIKWRPRINSKNMIRKQGNTSIPENVQNSSDFKKTYEKNSKDVKDKDVGIIAKLLVVSEKNHITKTVLIRQMARGVSSEEETRKTIDKLIKENVFFYEGGSEPKVVRIKGGINQAQLYAMWFISFEGLDDHKKRVASLVEKKPRQNVSWLEKPWVDVLIWECQICNIGSFEHTIEELLSFPKNPDRQYLLNAHLAFTLLLARFFPDHKMLSNFYRILKGYHDNLKKEQ